MKHILLLFLLGVTVQARAATEVVYFGGYLATQAQMNCWVKGAEAQSGYADYTFQAHPYPAGATSSKASAQQKGAATIAAVVAMIDGNPNMHFVVVGHSSGAALSDRVAELVKNPKQIDLINLDGFAPSSAVQRSVNSSRCIYARSISHKNLYSLNAANMETNCAAAESYADAHCSTSWCLHFSLVNEGAPAALGASTFAAHGYDGCQTNLSWL